MNDQRKITNAEWEVMTVLWGESPLTASEVGERLMGAKEWSPKTINTFLSRLLAKGALRVHKRSNLNFYSPAVTREECVAAEGQSFLQRFFDGASGALIAHFCQSGNLSDADIENLERMIEKAKAKRRKTR